VRAELLQRQKAPRQIDPTAGIRKVIPKPVDLGRLLPLVQEAVGKPG
jgi:hypothetical protein